MRLVFDRRPANKLFLRSEDFFNFTIALQHQREEMHEELRRVDAEYAQRSKFAQNQARMAYAGSVHSMEQRYGTDLLEAASHGESFLRLFEQRLTPGGLYLLDEPEAPLSPKRQLSFLVLLKQMLDQDGQFIIATHSPILMGYPGALILSCDSERLQPVAYEDLEHVTITRGFLNNPKLYQRELGIG
jgi:predicted ATPase